MSACWPASSTAYPASRRRQAGFAVDRFGARPILAGGLATIGVALGLISVVHSFAGFAAIAVIAGLGNCVFHPADFALLNSSVNQGRLGRAYSVMASAARLVGGPRR